MDQPTNDEAQSADMPQNIGNKDQPMEKRAYEKPKLRRVGHMSEVTQKSGPFSDGAVPNSTRPN